MGLLGCMAKEQADLLVYHAQVYTVDEQFSIAEAFAVKNGRIAAVDHSGDLRHRYSFKQELDVQGASVYPGFRDAHCHFISLGKSLSVANLKGATSYQEVLKRIAAHHATHPSEWITGAGWDQNLWPELHFPTNEEINRLYPNTPVVLKRIDGHAIVANKEAIRRVGIKVDDPSTSGIRVITDEQFLACCQKAFDAGLQVATHCIGDAASRNTLKLYSHFLKGENDLRWRIEHAQIVSPEDFETFKKYAIIPSVQPTHATSDMSWAIDRVGLRIKGGYAYHDLKNQLGWLPFGTDFPIEEVNPIHTFFAAVYRKNLDFLPEAGFQPENALSREDALRAMTIWPAKASFDEARKGSLEPGKWADFVILNNDIMTAPEHDLPSTQVIATYIAGQKMNF